jgi:hypothetical protein
MNELTQDQIDMIKTCGALHYTGYETAKLVGETNEQYELIRDHIQSGGAIRQIYLEGQIKARFAVESAIFAKARSGDKDAVEMYMAIINRNEK